jgi:hypothetical protein
MGRFEVEEWKGERQIFWGFPQNFASHYVGLRGQGVASENISRSPTQFGRVKFAEDLEKGGLNLLTNLSDPFTTFSSILPISAVFPKLFNQHWK